MIHTYKRSVISVISFLAQNEFMQNTFFVPCTRDAKDKITLLLFNKMRVFERQEKAL